MKADNIMSALQDVDPALLDAADAARQAPKKRGGIYRLPLAVRITAIAACAALLIVGVFGLSNGLAQPKAPVTGDPVHTTTTAGGVSTDEGTTTTTTETSTSDTTATTAPTDEPPGVTAPSASQSMKTTTTTAEKPTTGNFTGHPTNGMTTATTTKATVPTGFPRPGGDTSATPEPDLLKPLASPVYPERMTFPMRKDYTSDKTYNADLKAYESFRSDQARLGKQHADALDGYLTTAVPVFLKNEKQQNRIISPLNIYVALGMMTEVTAGNSREQLLQLLDAPDRPTLRGNVSDLWNATYQDDGLVTSKLASALWLRDDGAYHQLPLMNLAEYYYASAYSGEMGSDEYNRTLQAWLNENTGGRLSQYAANQTFKSTTTVAMTASLYYRANWLYAFYEGATKEAVFHTPQGGKTCDFMNQSRMKIPHVEGNGFSAVAIPVKNSGYMWVFLPDEGVSPDVLPAQQAVWDTVRFKKIAQTGKDVNLSLPKFDVSSEQDLCAALAELGVTDILDEHKADISPLTDSKVPGRLSDFAHAARVTVEEKGCEAAAFTFMQSTVKGPIQKPEAVDFIVDRPFFFVITGEGNLPLFAGTVYEPQS